MARKPVIIAGGGIAGLAAALGLARIGRDAIVLEQASGPEAIGAGLQLGPNAIRALKWLDAWDAIEPETYAPRALVIRDGVSGKILQQVPYGADFEKRFGETYRVIHRADLAGALALAAAGCEAIDLRYGRRLAEFTDTGSAVVVETQSGSEIAGEALIGADGIHSRVRELILADGPARALARTHYRALIKASAVPDEIESDSVCLWLKPGSHVVHYPIRDGSLINVVAAVDGKAAPDGGWSVEASRQEVNAGFAENVEPLRGFIAAARSWSRWPALDRPPAKTWSKGRVGLIGDAAHAALPYLAQGAAMALEDAVVLARTIEDESGMAAALSAYTMQRAGRAARLGTASARLASVYHASGPLRFARNAAMGLTPAPRFLDRLAWIYGYDAAQR